MLNAEIESQLLNSLPFLIASFNSLSKVLTYLKEVNSVPLNTSKDSLRTTEYSRLSLHIKLLLDYKNNILIVSPWNLKFDLREFKSVSGFDVSIDTKHPYKIYDLDHNLIYTCENHNGIFGLSVLDKWLIQKSKNMSSYYLSYKDINGENQIQLIVINLSSQQTLSSNPYYKPKTDYVKSNIVTIQNNKNSNVKIYTLFDQPSERISSTAIKLRGEEITITSFNQHLINTNNGPFWLLFDDLVEVAQVTNLQAPDNIVIPVINNSLYYMAFNTSPELVNRIFGTNLTTTNKSDNEQLILT